MQIYLNTPEYLQVGLKNCNVNYKGRLMLRFSPILNMNGVELISSCYRFIVLWKLLRTLLEGARKLEIATELLIIVQLRTIVDICWKIEETDKELK